MTVPEPVPDFETVSVYAAVAAMGVVNVLSDPTARLPEESWDFTR